MQVSRNGLRRAVLEDERRRQRHADLLLEVQGELCRAQRVESRIHKWRARCDMLDARVRFHRIEHNIE